MLRLICWLCGVKYVALACVNAFAQAQPPDRVERGRQLYEQFCENCHGPDMVNPGTVSFDLRRFPTDGKERFRSSVINGKGSAMPAWGQAITADEVESLWAYVVNGHKQ